MRVTDILKQINERIVMVSICASIEFVSLTKVRAMLCKLAAELLCLYTFRGKSSSVDFSVFDWYVMSSYAMWIDWYRYICIFSSRHFIDVWKWSLFQVDKNLLSSSKLIQNYDILVTFHN